MHEFKILNVKNYHKAI